MHERCDTRRNQEIYRSGATIMLGKFLKNLNYFYKTIDKQIVSMSFITMLAICYYVNPLNNVELKNWNRTFCSAVFSGISIDKRINQFYLLFLVFVPLIFVAVLALYNWLCNSRKIYKNSFFYFNILILFSIISSYISRYTSGSDTVVSNVLLPGILVFYLILAIISLIEIKQTLDFIDHVTLFVAYLVFVITANILFTIDLNTALGISGIALIIYVLFSTRTYYGKKYKKETTNLIYILMWCPAIIRLILEIIYFMTEKGYKIRNYHTSILGLVIAFFAIAVVIVFVFKNKIKKDFSEFGYTGAIVSLGMISFLGYTYQYVWSYTNMANLYEYGNPSTAMDSILYGKLPIIDYFSAHALKDVWTRILYSIIHSDIKGIFADPYAGISTVLSYLCLYYIVKNLFNKHIAILFVLLFPVNIAGIKLTSICCFSIVMLIHIIKKPGFKTFILYWLVVLGCALFTYDEGISLGLAGILAYVLLSFMQKEWKRLKDFIISGGIIGLGALVIYGIYGIVTKLDILYRLREWFSVSAGSNSTWATENFGDTSTLAFLTSYFIVPACAVIILVVTVYLYIKTKQKPVLATITIGFSITELLYITRTIPYHNLAVCNGRTGVLLNFIHWSAALFVLYNLSLRRTDNSKKLFGWISTLGIVIILEGALVTGQLPNSESVLYTNAASVSEYWDLRNNTTENWNQDRIIFDDPTNELISQFTTVFDGLMTDDQTFVDFANLTSLYALTGRKRPFYVGQSPSLLTDLYSQKCYLKELSEYDCPLAVIGTTDTAYLQQMVGIPHNVRYYKIAEHIYTDYRPLINFGEFSIWCKKDLHKEYYDKLSSMNVNEKGYTLTDYGYDATKKSAEGGYVYQPFHQYGLGMIPYIWANYDDYDAVNNPVIDELEQTGTNIFVFNGSQTVLTANGNYLLMECINPGNENISTTVTFQDSSNEGARYEYSFTVKPGTHKYMIRVSQDYFWDVYNINTISISGDSQMQVKNVKILEGD